MNTESLDTNLKVTKGDVSLVRKTLYALTAAQKVTCLIVAVVAANIWWMLCKIIIRFGAGLDYQGLKALGDNTYQIMEKYNYLIWWGLCAIVSIIIFYAVYAFVAATQRSIKHKNISLNTAQNLGDKLSHSGIQVLIWSWKNQQEPINIGVLQTTLAQMRSNRAGKISLLRQQKSIFNIE